MIKTLRYAFVAALMMVCGGTMSAQDAGTTTKKTTINFKDVYGEMEAENASKTVVYLEKHPINVEGISISFSKGKAAEAPNYTIDNGFVKLAGGSEASPNEGNTITYKSDDYITQINLIASNAAPWADLSVNVGTFTLSGKNGKNVVWVNKDNNGKYINTKEVIFTVCRASSTETGKKDNVRYTQTVVNTNSVETGINNITVDNAKKGVRYNLAGQRVNESYKGVVIENGKKMIVK